MAEKWSGFLWAIIELKGEREEISLPNFYLENLSQSGCIIFRQALFGRFIPPINKIKRNFCVVLSFKN